MLRGRRGTLLLGIIGLIAAALIGEIAVRLFARLDEDVGSRLTRWDPLHILIEPHGELGFRQKANAVFEYPNGTSATANARGYRGPQVVVSKPNGVFRVILLGGSTTHGWGVSDDSTVAASLARELESRPGARRYEVINLAFDGYDSWQVFERLRSDGLPLEPDLVVVNTGINDARNARYAELVDRDRRTLIWETNLQRLREDRQRGRPSLWSQMKHYSYLIRLPGFIRGMVWARRGQMEGRRIEQPYPEAADYFERNLRRIDSLLAANGIAAIYSTPPSSLFRYRPDARSHLSYWVGDATTTQAYRDTLASRMQGVAATNEDTTRSVSYLGLTLSAEYFLDDCHLTPQGNRAMAHAIAPLVP